MLHQMKIKKQNAPGSMQGWGKIYDGLVSIITFGREREIRQMTLDLVEIKPGDRILEVGCGTGSLALAAKIRGGAQVGVCGIDVATDMLETARRKAAKAGVEIEFGTGGIEKIPYPDRDFSLVFSSLMMHHVVGIGAKERGIGEVYRILKPGGRFVILDTEPRPTRLMKKYLNSGDAHANEPELAICEYIPMLETAGFVEIVTGRMKYQSLAFLTAKRPNAA